MVPDDEKDSQQDSFAEAEIVAIDEPSILPDQSWDNNIPYVSHWKFCENGGTNKLIPIYILVGVSE